MTKIMQKVIISSLMLVFFLWLLPLGYFIKPSQQKMACNGQRAICMCKAPVVAKVAPPTVAGVSYKAANQQNEKSPSNGSPGSLYVMVDRDILSVENIRPTHDRQQFSLQQAFLRQLEHVPKA